nr:S-layer homology domain-containing protein [Cohnella hashimotonis]
MNHWAKDAVEDMGSRMVVEGTGGGLFSPDREVTRAEFAAIVVRGLGLKPESGDSSFSDVAAGDWHGAAIATASAYGLIDGFADGTFRPNDKLTREQAMVIVSKALTITGLQGKLSIPSADAALRPFKDAAAVSAWAQEGVAASVTAGIATGRGDAKLAPKEAVTRAEVAALVQRLLQKSGLI